MGQGESITCSIGESVGRATLSLRGNVGILLADELLSAAREAAEGTSVRVDLSEAEHLDLASWQILLSLKHTLAKRGGELLFEAVPDALSRFLSMAGLDTAFRVAPSPSTKEDLS